ncbi:MAG: hypothetical protein M3439_05655 [Chloroflexota bacterium]|nr:hypothetical protein [Chloroflexota bacterium]
MYGGPLRFYCRSEPQRKPPHGDVRRHVTGNRRATGTGGIGPDDWYYTVVGTGSVKGAEEHQFWVREPKVRR